MVEVWGEREKKTARVHNHGGTFESSDGYRGGLAVLQEFSLSCGYGRHPPCRCIAHSALHFPTQWRNTKGGKSRGIGAQEEQVRRPSNPRVQRSHGGPERSVEFLFASASPKLSISQDPCKSAGSSGMTKRSGLGLSRSRPSQTSWTRPFLSQSTGEYVNSKKLSDQRAAVVVASARNPQAGLLRPGRRPFSQGRRDAAA